MYSWYNRALHNTITVRTNSVSFQETVKKLKRRKYFGIYIRMKIHIKKSLQSQEILSFPFSKNCLWRMSTLHMSYSTFLEIWIDFSSYRTAWFLSSCLMRRAALIFSYVILKLLCGFQVSNEAMKLLGKLSGKSPQWSKYVNLWK